MSSVYILYDDNNLYGVLPSYVYSPSCYIASVKIGTYTSIQDLKRCSLFNLVKEKKVTHCEAIVSTVLYVLYDEHEGLWIFPSAKALATTVREYKHRRMQREPACAGDDLLSKLHNMSVINKSSSVHPRKINLCTFDDEYVSMGYVRQQC